MDYKLSVRGAPQFYQCRNGILQELESLIIQRKKYRALVIHGKKSFEAARAYLPKFNAVLMEKWEYNGECSLEEIRKISRFYKQGYFDIIIGIGGGKVLDLAKAVSHEVKGPTVLIPTLASTCAAWTPLSVIYSKEGKFLYYEVYPQSTDIVLVEPEVILSSPVKYLKAGIADTLAKWYEADVMIRNLNVPPVPLLVAHHSARLCKDLLLEKGIKSLEDMKNRKLTSNFVSVIETNMILGGMVGGFGDEYGRVSGAHAIHNALTEFPCTHHLLHGEKVAYGILVQLAIEEQWTEIERLLPFYEKLSLPKSFKEIGLTNEIDIKQLATYAMNNHSLKLVDENINEDRVINALTNIESIVRIKTNPIIIK
ncbi:putative oxidoreductase [Bacillus pakistanensis]|uniref:Oxidoreductase n=1 Tax=Rossellomorea pakistanensis TaxID=992288 RepID=A0ABS2N845_9BACI|nr:iron-containing alcohol dehydrogenase family protein [Bacillus pakistanensis]MBM7584030.1 putative oxidoreductase [Bacillus pakistanensis]